MNKKTKRFHREIFFPDWAEDSIEAFIETAWARNSITISTHALEKVIDYGFYYGKHFLKFLLKSVRKNSVDSSKVFEFYAVDHTIKRACFRFSFEEFSTDIVLVISLDGVIVTVYTTNRADSHKTLDTKLYEKGV